MFQSEEPWPSWKMNTTIPNAAAERDEVQDHGLDRQHDRAERPGEQDQRQDHDEREHVREAAEEGVHEVAVDRGDAGERFRSSPSSAALARSMIPWIPGRGRRRSSGNASTSDVWSAPPVRGRGRADDSVDVAQLGRDRLCVAAVLDQHVERLHHARADARVGELVASGDRRAGAGEVLELRLVRDSSASRGRRARRRSRGRRAATGHGRRSTKRAQRPHAPSSGWPRSTKPLRHHAARC